MNDSKSTSTTMCTGQKYSLTDGKVFENPSLYLSTIGALQYLTMTNKAFVVNKLSQFLQAPTENHWTTCKHLLRHLKGTNSLSLHFKPIQRFNLECFTDADWASSIDDRRSTSGHCVLLGGNFFTRVLESRKWLLIVAPKLSI